MIANNFKIGDIVRIKGCENLFKVRGLYEDGFVEVIEITDEYDKRVCIRRYSEFELATEILLKK